MKSRPSGRPGPGEFAPVCADYVSRVPENDIVEALDRQQLEVRTTFAAIPESRAEFRYAPGKWSVKQLAGHLGDGERVFGYRALRFSRGDDTTLPGFEEDEYVAAAMFDARSLAALVEEFEHQRRANVLMFSSLSSEAWRRLGVASENTVSVRGLAYIMVGHVRHHLEVLRGRYRDL